ncbi:hypothetical protein ACFE04_029402 [Oxalis oulophora]
MSCFSCFSSHEKKARRSNSSRSSNRQLPSSSSFRQQQPPQQQHVVPHPKPENPKPSAQQAPPPQPAIKNRDENKDGGGNKNIAAETFTFRELATATRNFRQECLIGEGGFGRVYKGKLDKVDQVVAVKQLDRNGMQGNREFLVEVLMLSLLHHHNLVNLIGYCADGDQRLLVYEYMPLGSLEDHLLDLTPEQKPLDWYTRMKIALGAAKGLEYLHDIANPPAEPVFKDPSSFSTLADPLLKGNFPARGLNQAVAVAAMCLQEEAPVRPLISDVVSALSFLGSRPNSATSLPSPIDETPMDSPELSEENTINERQRAVAEAMEWASQPLNNKNSL